MSFIKCVQAKVDRKMISSGKAANLQNQYNMLVKRFKASMGDESAAVQAATKIVAVEAEQLAQKQRNLVNHALAQARIQASLASLPNYGKGVRDLLEQTVFRGNSVERDALSRLDKKFLRTTEANLIGEAKSTEGLGDVVRAIYGDVPKNGELKGLAESVADTFDYLHKRYKAAGGIIGSIENYFPQRHLKAAIESLPGNASEKFTAWWAELKPRLDTDRMIDVETGLPFDLEKLDRIAYDSFQDIITDGKHSIRKELDSGATFKGRGGDVSERKNNSRFFHFKSADDFLEYNRKFGVGDDGLADLIYGHIKSISKDIGMLEKMGPKPKAVFNYVLSQMEARGANGTEIGWTTGMFKILTGADQLGGDGKWVRAFSTVQNWLRASMLGSASISAMTDSTFVVATARLKGIPAMKTAQRYLKLLNPVNGADRELAKTRGYLAEVMSSSVVADARFAGENLGGKATNFLDRFASRAAQFTNRASGLQTMTKGAADAISLEFEATLAEHVSSYKSFADIPSPEFKDALTAHGIGEKEWDILRKAKIFEHPDNGAKFLGGKEIVEVRDIKGAEQKAIKLEEETAASSYIDYASSRLRGIESIRKLLGADEAIKQEITSVKGKIKRGELSSAIDRGLLQARLEDQAKGYRLLFSERQLKREIGLKVLAQNPELRGLSANIKSVASELKNKISSLEKTLGSLERSKAGSAAELKARVGDLETIWNKKFNLTYSEMKSKVGQGKSTTLNFFGKRTESLKKTIEKDFQRAEHSISSVKKTLETLKKFNKSLTTDIAEGDILLRRGKYLGEAAKESLDAKSHVLLSNKEFLSELQILQRKIKNEISATAKTFGRELELSSQLPATNRRLDLLEDLFKERLSSGQERLARAEETSIKKAGLASAARSMDVANKVDDFVSSLRAMVTNEPTLRTRSIATAFGASRDNALRAFVSSVTMFKSFPITVTFNHLIPAFQKASQGKYEHLATMVIGTSALGFLALQLKEVSKGRTPKEWDKKLLISSMLQGGGLGLFGDFILGDYSRFGRSPISEAFGPVAGLADDLYRSTKGQFDRYLDDKDPNLLRDVFKTVKRNVPGVSLWYSRLVVERLILDQMERMVDPKFDRNITRYERKIRKDFGQEYWWRPGEVTPEK